jgi:hypothetical protein
MGCLCGMKLKGSGRVLQPKTTPQRRPTPSTSWLKVQNSDHRPQTGKGIQCVCCSKDKPGKDLKLQSAKWCFLLTWIRFKCSNYSVGLGLAHCLRVFHTKLQYSEQLLTGKSRLHKYQFSLYMDIVRISVYFI